jgi:hypothetical protein
LGRAYVIMEREILVRAPVPTLGAHPTGAGPDRAARRRAQRGRP